MSEQTVSFCDICNKNMTYLPHNGRGFIVWDEKMAIKNFGWERLKNGKVMCCECADEKEEEEKESNK